jgi:hypothetical protein
LPASQTKLFIRSGVVCASRHAIANEISAGPVPLLDVCSQEPLADLQLVVVSELDAEVQLTKRDMASAWNTIRREPRSVNLVVDAIIRTEDETGLQLVGFYLPLGYVTQQLRLEGSRQERQMVQCRNDTRR